MGGEGSWGYLDFEPVMRRLFISRATKVVVLDVDSGKVAGEILNTPGVHGVALAPDLGRGFTSNSEGNNVTVFDLETFKTIVDVPAGMEPDTIVYDPSSKRTFAMNAHSQNITAIDAATGRMITTLAVHGRPESAVADGGGRIYVNIADRNEQAVIDSQNLAVTGRWSISPCNGPTGIAMDVPHRRLFAACSNRMMIVSDADSGKVISNQPIDQGADSIAYDPATGYILSSNGDSGTLTVVHEDTPNNYTFVEVVITELHARTMALDRKNGQIFLVAAAYQDPLPQAKDAAPAPPVLVPGSFVVLVYGK